MSHLKIKPECIIEEFFKSIQKYVNEAIIERINLMDSLYDFSMKSWEIPKKYKGSSSQMGFIAEYLVFEVIKQYIAEENKISFFPVVRTKTSLENIETYYFVNDKNNPIHLLCQGLQVYDTVSANFDLPKTNYAHDIMYLIRNDTWSVKAVFEVKSYFDTPGLKEDINRLVFAEKVYPVIENSAFVFVGFKNQDQLSGEEKKVIQNFTKEKNHFCVLPGERNPQIGNSKLEEVLGFIS